MKKMIPNAITVLRIVGAAALMVLPLFTRGFFIVYVLCAAFDFLDGFFAKILDAKTELGNRLDHIASLLFIAALSIRLVSSINVPDWAIYVLMGIAFIKCASIVFGAVRFKKAPFINSDWNKAAKFTFYFIPVWYMFAGMIFTCVVVLFVLLVAAVEELVINLTSKKYDPDIKTIIPLKKFVKKSKTVKKIKK